MPDAQGSFHLRRISGTEDLQLIYSICITSVTVFLDSTSIFNTSPETINIGFCLLAHAQSFCGGGPTTLPHRVHWLNPIFAHAQLAFYLDCTILAFTKFADSKQNFPNLVDTKTLQNFLYLLHTRT